MLKITFWSHILILKPILSYPIQDTTINFSQNYLKTSNQSM